MLYEYLRQYYDREIVNVKPVSRSEYKKDSNFVC